MTPVWMHALSLAHGLFAAFVSLAVFYLAGLVLLPHRWSGVLRWPDRIALGLSLYVLLCWVATTSRNIPLSYVTFAFGGGLWALMSLRFRRLQTTFQAPLLKGEARRWIVGFSSLYVFVYVLVLPAPGAILSGTPSAALDLITYARYAKQLFAYGTAGVDFASFEHVRSPASAYLLAWHSLLFAGDALDAAMPALFMVAALFGLIAADFARSVFGLSRWGSMAVAAMAVCAPLFRWTLATYGLGELVAASAILYLAGVAGQAAIARQMSVALVARAWAGCVLVYFAGRSSIEVPGAIASGIGQAVRSFSPLAVLGLPGRFLAEEAPEGLRAAALALLPFVPVLWAAAAYALLRFTSLEWAARSPDDRRLVRALVAFVGAAIIIGNVAVQAVASPEPVRWPRAWQQLDRISLRPFPAVTLKMADEPNGVSTALALYYLPVRKAELIGRDVSANELPFDTVSRQQPMFIQNFGCEGVGHDDTVSAGSVGCLLMEPPSMTVGTSYPFNRTFLFMHFDRMTAREPGGRWNTHPTLNLKLTADPQRARLDREMYVNFLVHPFLPAGARSLRLVLRWGKDRRGEIVVGDQQWLTLAVGSSDWSGNRLWTVPVAIDFPDGRTILFQEVALTETPRGPLAQPTRAAP